MRDWLVEAEKHKHVLLIGLMLALVFLANQWVLGKNNGFLFDDYAHLATVKFQTAGSLAHLLPRMRYNDRPVGTIAIKIMNQFFGNDFRAYHTVLLFFHLLNAGLLYRLAEKLVKQVSAHNGRFVFLPFITAVIFGICPRSTFCVQWVAGIFDLLSATAALLVFNLYIDFRTAEKARMFNALLLLVFYYTGLRVKEMLLVLPVVLLTYDMFIWVSNHGLNWNGVKKYRPNLLLLVLLVMMTAYYAYFVNLDTGAAIVNTTTSPYFYTLHPAVLGTNLLRYLAIYFDYGNFAYGFIGFTAPAVVGLVFMFTVLLAGLVQAVRSGKPVLLALGCALVISLAPVLPMKNMQHMLYWYIPSLFLSLILGLVFNALVEKGLRSGGLRLAANLGAAALVIGLGFTRSVGAFRNDWTAMTMKNQVTIADLQKLPKPAKGTVIYVLGAKDMFNVFFYGPGAVNKVLFNDESLRTVLDPERVDRTPPYLILNYREQDGHVERIE